MSKIYDGWRGKKKDQPWYIKIGDGSIYGPADLEALSKWAAECRIFPGNEVSQDRQTWRPVQDLPELDMEWMVTLTNGKTFGPIHESAVNGLIRSGAVAPRTLLINKKTGETKAIAVADAAVMAAAPALSVSLENQASAPAVGAPSASEPARKDRALDEQVVMLTSQLDAARRAGDERAREIELQKGIYAKAQDENRKKIKELQQQVDALQKEQAARPIESATTDMPPTSQNEAARLREKALTDQIKAIGLQLKTARAAGDGDDKRQEKHKTALKKVQDEARKREKELLQQIEALMGKIHATPAVITGKTGETPQSAETRKGEGEQVEQSLAAQVRGLTVQVDKARTEIALRDQSLAEHEERYRKLQAEMLASEQARLSQAGEAQLQGDLTKMDRHNRELAQQLEDYAGRVQVAEGGLAEKDQQLQQLQEKLREAQANGKRREQELQQELRTLTAQLGEMRAAGNPELIARLREQLQQVEAGQEVRERDHLEQVRGLTEQFDKARTEIALRDQSLAEHEERNRKLQAEILASEQARLSQADEALPQGDLTEMGRRYRELAQQLEDYTGRVQVAEGGLAEKDQQVQQLQEKLREAQANGKRREQELQQELRTLTAQLGEMRAAGNPELIAMLREQLQQVKAGQEVRERDLLSQVEQLKTQLAQSVQCEQLLAPQVESLKKQVDAAVSMATEKNRVLEQQRQKIQVQRDRMKEVEQLLAQRAERAENEVQTMSRQLAKVQLQLDERASVEKDLRDEALQRTNELDRLREELAKAAESAATREAELALTAEELQTQCRAATERTEQLEWDLKHTDTQWLDFKEEQETARKEMQARICELERRHAEDASRNEELRAALAQGAQEIEQQKKTVATSIHRQSQLECDVAQYKRLLEEEWGRAQRRDEDLVAARKSYGEELARRQNLEGQVLDFDGQAREWSETQKQLQDELDLARTTARDEIAKAHEAQALLAGQLNEAHAEGRNAARRLAESQNEIERLAKQLAAEESLRNADAAEVGAHVAELQTAFDRVSALHEQAVAELDQVRLQAQDERETLMVKLEDCKSRLVQLQHENTGLSQRLDQQRKFFEAEREQRRQREQELQQLRKAGQDALEEHRQKDRAAAQQRKLDEEALGRSRQREERLVARLEQIQTSYANLLARPDKTAG